eukprot:scaffold210470_cov28-Tisochrysis_lutea.AAC.3
MPELAPLRFTGSLLHRTLYLPCARFASGGARSLARLCFACSGRISQSGLDLRLGLAEPPRELQRLGVRLLRLLARFLHQCGRSFALLALDSLN